MGTETFQKRQKELARQDRQRAKVERRMQRKLEKQAGGPSEPDISPAEDYFADEDLEKGAKDKNDEAIGMAAKAIGSSCQTCHNAHRDRQTDGTSLIK